MPRPRKTDQIFSTDDLTCDDKIVHIDAVLAARKALPAGTTLAALAGLFAAMGDPSRIRILAALGISELCVCDLAATVGLSESAVSHQLRQLRALGVVSSRREGRLVYYALDDDHVRQLFTQGLDHVAHRQEQV